MSTEPREQPDVSPCTGAGEGKGRAPNPMSSRGDVEETDGYVRVPWGVPRPA